MAASGSTVSVLTPNGRRQTVKVSANTPLLQVLEDVCKKHGFNPEEHGLKCGSRCRWRTALVFKALSRVDKRCGICSHTFLRPGRQIWTRLDPHQCVFTCKPRSAVRKR
ncbi:hypothetical protein cypCar_00046589 [Cyprinus carpio]|nr:hypothetical protein cypCar_00046589 [Cyprinus carpio]